jgi:hypothetical protein
LAKEKVPSSVADQAQGHTRNLKLEGRECDKVLPGLGYSQAWWNEYWWGAPNEVVPATDFVHPRAEMNRFTTEHKQFISYSILLKLCPSFAVFMAVKAVEFGKWPRINLLCKKESFR